METYTTIQRVFNIINRASEEFEMPVKLEDENDIEVAKAQLDLDDNDERPIYLTHDCKFALRK